VSLLKGDPGMQPTAVQESSKGSGLSAVYGIDDHPVVVFAYHQDVWVTVRTALGYCVAFHLPKV